MIDLEFTAGFIAEFEGFVGQVYLDAVGVETIGYGETKRDIIERYRQSGVSQPAALGLLKQRVQEFADAVEACVANAGALTPDRHAALTSFAYNIGVGGFRESTACKRFNAGDIDGVPEAIGWWNKAGGQVLEGLSRRRAAECALFAQSVRSAPGLAQLFAVGAPTVLREGDRGEEVRDAQRRLAARGWALAADGVFGPETAEAVRAFQRLQGLDPDGVLGPVTRQSLWSTGSPPWPGRLLRQGLEGEDVRQAQSRLAERGWGLGVDGSFGPTTDAIVRSYQNEKTLVVDGEVGELTWQSLWTAPITGGGTRPDLAGPP